jgi:hypothetical protein
MNALPLSEKSVNKKQGKLLGMSWDQARDFIMTFSRGAEENGNSIRFVYKGWNWAVYFKDGICDSVNCKVIK